MFSADRGGAPVGDSNRRHGFEGRCTMCAFQHAISQTRKSKAGNMFVCAMVGRTVCAERTLAPHDLRVCAQCTLRSRTTGHATTAHCRGRWPWPTPRRWRRS
eukprot:8201225-Lingulodinium_polyedra.AAC.1